MTDRPDTRDIASAYDPEQVVVRDKRRVDPATGEPREGAAATPPPTGEAEPAPETAPVVDEGEARLAELTGDLQRLSAEYANYRKRVARDATLLQEAATADLVGRLLPLLDDVDRAREHGDLDGAFKVVGEGLETLVARLGVERFGASGDAFDPQVHEAVMTAPEDPALQVTTCVQVFQAGFRTASGRVLRPATVVVAEPVGGPAEPAEAQEG